MTVSPSLPRDLYTAAQVRELDRMAIEDLGIPAQELMQRAGRVAFEVLRNRWPQVRQIRVFAGPGNNGGDGYVLASLARHAGLPVTLIAVGEPRGSGAAAWAAAEARAAGVEVLALDVDLPPPLPGGQSVVVDALLGIGLDRSVTGDMLVAINRINAMGVPVLALDVPSGLDSDTGVARGAVVAASVTLTFIGVKQGLLTQDGVACRGELVWHGLDLPPEWLAQPSAPTATAQRIDMPTVSRWLWPRQRTAHKGDFGHCVVIGGDLGMGGAALMAAQAALRSGAGKVSVITRPVHVGAILARQPEVMVLGVDGVTEAVIDWLARATVWVLGPGLGRSEWSRSMFAATLSAHAATDSPMVLDADGLNLLSDRRLADRTVRRNHWILTPHPGEAARLLNLTVAEVQADRFNAARRLQATWGGACVLKGAGSVLCTGPMPEPLSVCTEGNPGMASGGMGDVLSGVIGGLLAQGWSAADALKLGVCVHGESADLAAAAGERGMAATDLLTHLRTLLNLTEDRG